MSSEAESQQALRLLLLPIRPARENACSKMLAETLSKMGVLPLDHVPWVRVALGAWQDSGAASPQLKQLVAKVLDVGDPTFGPKLATKYFGIHSRLRTKLLLSHTEATAFLSHALLVADLANEGMLSAAHISRIVAQRDMRVPFSRQSIGLLLRSLGLPRTLDDDRVKTLFEADSLAELTVLADADLEVAAHAVAQFGDPLGFPSERLETALRALATTAQPSLFGPYVQMLHYQCIVAEFFDHAVTDLYEFRPRGKLPNWVFKQYPDSMGVSGNPFLNNAKSVERISLAWVRSKGPRDLAGARSLYEILSGLDALGFAARRELARMIRLWALRAIRISRPLAAVLPSSLSVNQIQKILYLVASGNTGSFGVIEQRVVDALSSALHDATNGWRARGLKDAVNATNISGRKLGDVDFQNSARREIHAYESHGGKLTDAYVQDHLRTLRRSMALRVEELSGIADPSEWRVTITFIAHELAPTCLPTETICGVPVCCKAISFSDFLDSGPPATQLVKLFGEYFLEPICQRRTPMEIRQLVSSIL